MAQHRAPLLVRPLHVWFDIGERAFPPRYRVLAVAVAALLTTVLLVAITPVRFVCENPDCEAFGEVVADR